MEFSTSNGVSKAIDVACLVMLCKRFPLWRSSSFPTGAPVVLSVTLRKSQKIIREPTIKQTWAQGLRDECLEELWPGTSKLRNTLWHGRLTHSRGAEAASIPTHTWGYMSCGDFITSCWGLQGWARWPLVSESPRQKQRVAGSVGARSYPRSRWMLGWDTCQDNPILSFIAGTTQVRLCHGALSLPPAQFALQFEEGGPQLSPYFFHRLCSFGAYMFCISFCSLLWQRHATETGTEREMHLQTQHLLCH